MLLREVLGFIEDVRLCVDFQTRIRKPQPGRNFADTDDRYAAIISTCHRLHRLLTELTTERDSVLVKDVAQTFRHAEGTTQENNITASLMRLTNGGCHLFDPAMKPFGRLSSDKER